MPDHLRTLVESENIFDYDAEQALFRCRWCGQEAAEVEDIPHDPQCDLGEAIESLRPSPLDFPDTTVKNIREANKLSPLWRVSNKYIYIGRQNASSNVEESDWYNPFKMETEEDRETVVEQFREYFLNERPDLQLRIPELVGKTLVCWCAPASCHGDVLAYYANQYRDGLWEPNVIEDSKS